MDEILAKLEVVITQLDSKSVVLGLGGSGDQLTEALQALVEGKLGLRRARASFRRAHYLLQKGYGKLVGPEDG